MLNTIFRMIIQWNMGICFTMYLNYIFLIFLAVLFNLGLRMTFMPALYSSPCTFYSRLINWCLQLLKYLSAGNLTDLCWFLSHSLPVLIPIHLWMTMTLPQLGFYLSFSSFFFSFFMEVLLSSHLPFLKDLGLSHAQTPNWFYLPIQAFLNTLPFFG